MTGVTSTANPPAGAGQPDVRGPDADEPRQPGARRARQKLAGRNVGLYVVFAAIIAYLSFASDAFLTSTNVFDILRQASFVMILALGMTFVIMTAGIDLSVGSMLGLSAGIASWLMIHGAPMGVGVAGAIATGMACGLLNGVIITRLGVTDFIATLATLSAFRGCLFLLTSGVPFASFATDDFSWLGRGEIGPVPVPVVVTALLFAFLLYLLKRFAFGRHVVAVGSNREAAELAGIRVRRTKIAVYVLMGGCAGLAGVLLSSRLGSVPPDLGTGYELSAIAAVVIGGTSLFGGRGTLLGTVVGALMVATINNGLVLLNVNPYYQYIINGALVVLAVALNRSERT